MMNEFLDAVVEYRPMIIDTSPTNGRVPPLDPAEREKWAGDEKAWLLHEMANILAYIDANYDQVDVIGSRQWPVYVHSEKEPLDSDR
jgi:hypothetical protein